MKNLDLTPVVVENDVINYILGGAPVEWVNNDNIRIKGTCYYFSNDQFIAFCIDDNGAPYTVNIMLNKRNFKFLLNKKDGDTNGQLKTC